MYYRGLTPGAVLKLKNQYGENSLPAKESVSWLRLFFSQFNNSLMLVLFVVILLSIFFKEYSDAILIMIVVLIDALMGFFQEYKSQKIFNKLKNYLKPKVIVIRSGVRIEIDAKELLPGDLAVVGSGDKVAADGELIEGINILVNESIITGEEEPVIKRVQADADSLLYMGTTIVSGSGIMKVKQIGQQTQMGKIGQQVLSVKEEKTTIQNKLDGFIKSLTVMILAICAGIFFIGLIREQHWWHSLQMSLILATAAIPKGLPVAITVVLALGMARILKEKGLVKKMLSLETLGSTSVICLDKTGTLTEGIMKIDRFDVKDEKRAVLALTLVNNQRTAIEVAIWNYLKGQKHGPQHLYDSYPRIYEEPFDSEKKYTVSINIVNGQDQASLMGAPEIIADFCGLTSRQKKKILSQIDEWTSRGLRVLGVAYKDHGNLKLKKNYRWLGLIGIEDPIRVTAKEAIEKVKNAGIDIKIVTGDYLKTAEKIAASAGLATGPGKSMEGNELESISIKQLIKRIDQISIFARVLPHQKLKIVSALQQKGEIVAMTGDGVNDAPALKQANIGIVVGSATEVAKEVGDLVLLDSNFNTIVSTIEQGRLIFSNITKIVAYILSNSFVEIILIFGAMLLGLPAPLIVVQILWIQLICDGPLDIILAFEKKEKDLMKEKPKTWQKMEILPSSMRLMIFIISSVGGISALMLFNYYYKLSGDLALARTITFAAVATIDLFYIFSFKNLKKTIFSMGWGIFNNPFMMISLLLDSIIILAAIYLPVLNDILDTKPLTLDHWLVVIAICLVITLIIELIKIISRIRPDFNFFKYKQEYKIN